MDQASLVTNDAPHRLDIFPAASLRGTAGADVHFEEDSVQSGVSSAMRSSSSDFVTTWEGLCSKQL